MTAFAAVEDVLVTRRQDTQDARYLATVERYLEDATADLTREVGYGYLRDPETGTSTFTVNGTGCDVLHVHEGLASLTSVEIRASVSDTWTTIDGDEWALEGDLGVPEDRIPAGEPAFHVVLLPGGSYSAFPGGRLTVRLTGARGWAAVPSDARSSTVALVRQRLGLDQTGQGGQAGPQEFGAQVSPDRWPNQVWKFIHRERDRHRGCSL